MKKIYPIFLFFFLIKIWLAGSSIPKDYKLVYEQEFLDASSKNDFVTTDASVWNWGKDKKYGYIEHSRKSDYTYKVRSPYNIALVRKIVVKEFILDAKLQQTGKEYGHRDMCVFYNFQDRSNFYYTHIASVTDKHAHNCFIVRDKPRIKISFETTDGHNWSAHKWHDLRVIRKYKSGEIAIYMNDLSKPIMRAVDKTFEWGQVGFGSFDDTGRIGSIQLYAPEVKKIPQKDPFLAGRPAKKNEGI